MHECQISKMMTYYNTLLTLKSHDHLILWPTCGHLKTYKTYISWSLNLAGWWLQGGGSECKQLVRSARKRLSRHWLLVIIELKYFHSNSNIIMLFSDFLFEFIFYALFNKFLSEFKYFYSHLINFYSNSNIFIWIRILLCSFRNFLLQFKNVFGLRQIFNRLQIFLCSLKNLYSNSVVIMIFNWFYALSQIFIMIKHFYAL